MSEYVKETSADSFSSDVIDASDERLILVDFWASWCAPCRALGPVLERLAGEYQGRFELVKIDADREGTLAQQFAVRGLPTVKAFRHGEVIDEFVGALPEPAIREFIDRHLDKPSNPLIDEARALAEGNPGAGIELLQRVHDHEPDNHAIALALAELQTRSGNAAEARQLLAKLPANIATAGAAQHLSSQLDLLDIMDTRIDDDDPLQRNFDRARREIAAGHFNQALDTLGNIVVADPTWQDGLARRAMLAVFAVPGPAPEQVSDWRRRLASLMH